MSFARYEKLKVASDLSGWELFLLLAVSCRACCPGWFSAFSTHENHLRDVLKNKSKNKHKLMPRLLNPPI